MCHMGARMGRSLWDVKAPSFVNRLSQKKNNFEILKKNFKPNSLRKLLAIFTKVVSGTYFHRIIKCDLEAV